MQKRTALWTCLLLLLLVGCPDSSDTGIQTGLSGDQGLSQGQSWSPVGSGSQGQGSGPVGTSGGSPSVCVPQCGLAVCGDDGCGGLCGACSDGSFCLEGQCQVGECSPDCVNKACGDDGCGTLCGTCSSSAQCVDGQCVSSGCAPSCDGAVCGSDGCGGSCGECESGYSCEGGQCDYDPCTSDPCAVPPEGTLPALCVGSASCFSDADCKVGSNWSVESLCVDGLCTNDVRTCSAGSAGSDCYTWCLETYAETYSLSPDFSYCEDQVWSCAQVSDCPNTPFTCVAESKCTSNSDCMGNWMVSSTCDGEKCVWETRECESGSDCYTWCVDTYAEAYAAGVFSYCEDQVWQCNPTTDCPDSPKQCVSLAPCVTADDCANTWLQTHTCEEGLCIPEWVDCTEPGACYAGCLEAYESSYDVVSDFSYCEEQVWGCQ